MRIFRTAVTAALVTTAIMAVPTAAAAKTSRLSEPATGLVWECENHTYTVVSGTLEYVLRISEDPEEPTGHISVRASAVRAVDESGDTYAIHGTATSNARMHNDTFAITDTLSFQIVGRGVGRTDSLSGVFMTRPNGGSFELVNGSCDFPA